MATRQSGTNFMNTVPAFQLPHLLALWTDGLETSTQEMERFQTALWEQSLRGLTMFRQQVDANIEFMRAWSQTWQKLASQQWQHIANLANTRHD